MSERRKAASTRPNTPVLIVANNLDFPIRYAAWFGARQAKAASTAAENARFHVIAVNTTEMKELASRLVEGAVENGDLQLAQVDGNLASELDALIVARQTAEAEAKAAIDVAASATETRSYEAIWEDLKPGALVLAADLDRRGTPEAWYEAQIIGLEGPEFLLRFRDFPRDGVLRRTRRHIAILCPAS